MPAGILVSPPASLALRRGRVIAELEVGVAMLAARQASLAPQRSAQRPSGPESMWY